jgi:hypothetical protein
MIKSGTAARPVRALSFEEEFLALLEKSGIPYDAKHVFG